jgi:hypothetical protein
MGCVVGICGSGETTLGVDAWDVGSNVVGTLGVDAWDVGSSVVDILGIDAWDVGSDVVGTLGSGAPTLGGDAWDVGSGRVRGGLKMARRLSTAKSCAWQLSGVRSARMATVSARRQWMTRSVVVSVGIDSVGCWKVTVSVTTTAEVDVLITV